jgi:hypothetical protein
MQKNTIPELIDAVRPNLPTVARWVGASVWTARIWQQGTYQPKPKQRAVLVKAVRKHAKELLALAEKVEREGKAQHGGK